LSRNARLGGPVPRVVTRLIGVDAVPRGESGGKVVFIPARKVRIRWGL